MEKKIVLEVDLVAVGQNISCQLFLRTGQERTRLVAVRGKNGDKLEALLACLGECGSQFALCHKEKQFLHPGMWALKNWVMHELYGEDEVKDVTPKLSWWARLKAWWRGR